MLYKKILELLIERINKSMIPGDMLPSQRKLSEEYNVSRITIKRVIKELEELGYVTTFPGSGSFVADLNSTIGLGNSYSFTEQMKMLGKSPQSKILEFSSVEINSKLKRYFKSQQHVIKIKRLRLADNIPMMVEETFLSQDRFGKLKKEELEGKSLRAIIQDDFGEKIKVIQEDFIASVASHYESELLMVKEGHPILVISRLTYNRKNEIIEYTESFARSDLFTYRSIIVNK